MAELEVLEFLLRNLLSKVSCEVELTSNETGNIILRNDLALERIGR